MISIGGSTPSYDSNGNVTNDFLNSYAWDADGQPLTVNGVSNTYDALGRMVEQDKSGTYYEVLYAPGGDKLAFMTGQSLYKAYVPLPAGDIAAYNSSGLNNYHHMDWLGSFRLMSYPNRTVPFETAYAPFGEQYATSGSATAAFTGQTQDTSANVYDFPAREYGIQGRWPSPDPAGLSAVDSRNPQSWNRYAYVLNNPLALTDPTGQDPFGAFCESKPEACAAIPIIGIGVGIYELFSHIFGGGPPPQAPPPPPGGYGSGIDPYGTWNEQLPAGVQALPSPIPGMNNPGGPCTYGSGNCGGMVYGFMPGNGSPQWANYFDYLTWLKLALTEAGSEVVGFPNIPAQSQSPNFEAYHQCISQFLTQTYGAGAPSYVNHTSAFNLFSAEGGLTTAAIEGSKIVVGAFAKTAGATTAELGGAFSIPGALGTALDAQAQYVCSGVSGENPF